jgi:hypothetical protein
VHWTMRRGLVYAQRRRAIGIAMQLPLQRHRAAAIAMTKWRQALAAAAIKRGRNTAPQRFSIYLQATSPCGSDFSRDGPYR